MAIAVGDGNFTIVKCMCIGTTCGSICKYVRSSGVRYQVFRFDTISIR